MNFKWVKFHEMYVIESRCGPSQVVFKTVTVFIYLFHAGGSVECTTVLLAKGANVNIRSKDGSTALFKAIDSNHCECAHLLLQHSADPNPPSGI